MDLKELNKLIKEELEAIMNEDEDMSPEEMEGHEESHEELMDELKGFYEKLKAHFDSDEDEMEDEEVEDIIDDEVEEEMGDEELEEVLREMSGDDMMSTDEEIEAAIEGLDEASEETTLNESVARFKKLANING